MFKSTFKRIVIVFAIAAGLICGNSFHRIGVSGDDSLLSSKFDQELKSDIPSEITTISGIEMVLIPAGEFTTSYIMERLTKSRRIIITEPFYLGKYPVTQSQWEEIMGSNPSKFKGDSDSPVENVTWDTVQEFIQRINAKESTNRYRLPTDAEWEYAVRANTQTKYFWGDEIAYMDKYVWHRENSGAKTHPVGMKLPNQWGLYDMLGNVYELVQDKIDGKYYIYNDIIDYYDDASVLIDPVGNSYIQPNYHPDLFNTLRGWSWSSGRTEISVDKRSPGLIFYLDKESGNIGFRLSSSVD